MVHGSCLFTLPWRTKQVVIELTFLCEEGRDRIPDVGSTSISDRSRGIPAHLLHGRHDENVHFLQNGRIPLTVNGANFMRAEEKADRSPLNQFGAVFLPGGRIESMPKSREEAVSVMDSAIMKHGRADSLIN
jgi:hypothetical protein